MSEENRETPLLAGRADAGPGRLAGFSDGVFAVIITIMAFELRPPGGTDLRSLAHRLPALLIYVLSFTFVGIYWNNHHHLIRATERITGAVMWANLHLLFWLSLIPVLTQWVGTGYRDPLPAAAYGVVALGSAIAYVLLARTIVAAHPPSSTVARAIGADRKGLVSELLYAAGIGLAFVSPYLAYGAYVTVAAIWFVPDSRFERVAVRAGEPGGPAAP